MSCFEDDTLYGAGTVRLEMFVENNLLRAGKDVLDFDARKHVLPSDVRHALQRAVKMASKSAAHLEHLLANDDDHLALYRLLEAAYIISAVVKGVDLGPAIKGKLDGKSGGDNSADKRANDMEEWRGEALLLAQEWVRGEPTATNAAILKHIRDNLGARLKAAGKNVGLRSDDTYRRAIREWRKNGKLPQ